MPSACPSLGATLSYSFHNDPRLLCDLIAPVRYRFKSCEDFKQVELSSVELTKKPCFAVQQ